VTTHENETVQSQGSPHVSQTTIKTYAHSYDNGNFYKNVDIPLGQDTIWYE